VVLCGRKRQPGTQNFHVPGQQQPPAFKHNAWYSNNKCRPVSAVKGSETAVIFRWNRDETCSIQWTQHTPYNIIPELAVQLRYYYVRNLNKSETITCFFFFEITNIYVTWQIRRDFYEKRYLIIQSEPQRKHNVSITNIKWLTLFGELIVVYSENHIKPSEYNACEMENYLILQQVIYTNCNYRGFTAWTESLKKMCCKETNGFIETFHPDLPAKKHPSLYTALDGLLCN
jgi:hypothetical protein